MLVFKRPTFCAAVSFGVTAAATLGAASVAHAQDAPPLVAYLGANGEVSVRNASTGKNVATIRPALFEQTWQMRSLSPTGAFGADANANQTTSNIKAANAGATVAVQSRVSLAAPNTLHFVVQMTPDKTVKVNSVHVSIEVPSGDWVGGTASLAGGAALPVPAAAAQTQLVSGVGAITLQKNGASIKAEAAGKSGMVQDNRVFGNAGLEMRFGTQLNDGGEWQAGKTEAFDVTVTLPQNVAIVREAPVTLRAGADWVPFTNVLDPAPGSALDFSNLLDAPAGKYGRVIALPSGHFGFEKRKTPQRFYGVNFAFSGNYFTHDEADRIADRLARIGYNSVRIHHYEGELVDPNAPNSTTFRADSLDKLDYLVYALKKRGLYLTTDLFVSRPVKDAETGLANGGADFKAALLVSPAAMDNWKTFSKNLLTHVNPYTKIAYKDEPALGFICVVNEPNLGGSLGGMTGALREAYQKEWHTYLASRYDGNAALQAAWANTNATRNGADLPKNIDTKTREGRDTAAFIVFLHKRGYQIMRDFLRNEVGTKILLTDNNGWSETPALMAARTELDYVDNHFYWDHPSFLEKDWQLPSRGWSGGTSALAAGGAGPSGVAQTRLVGKPFTVSEYDYAAPNAFRPEGALLMGAAAALQDWDAVWRFAYSHGHDASLTPTPIDYFNMANDPGRQATERAALMLFLRGDLKPAPHLLTLERKRADLETPGPKTPAPPSGFGDLALVTRVGTRLDDIAAPKRMAGETVTNQTDGAVLLKNAKALPQGNRTDLTNGNRESETGEVFVNGEKTTLQIRTPKTVGGIANPGDTLTSGPLTLSVKGARAAIWVSSLDNLPVAQSRRLLLAHVPDVENSGMAFAGPDRQVLTAWGTLPYLVKQGTASLTLSRTVPGDVTVYRLDAAGNRVAKIPSTKKNNTTAFAVSTLEAGAKNATLYYEIVATSAKVNKAAKSGRVSVGNGLQ